MTPEELDMLLSLGGLDDEQAMANQQLQYGQRLMQPSRQPSGSALNRFGASLGNAFDRIGGAIISNQARGEQQKLIGRRRKAQQLIGRIGSAPGLDLSGVDAPGADLGDYHRKVAQLEADARALIASEHPLGVQLGQRMQAEAQQARKYVQEAPTRALETKLKGSQIDLNEATLAGKKGELDYAAGRLSQAEIGDYKAIGGKQDLSQLTRREAQPIIKNQIEVYKSQQAGAKGEASRQGVQARFDANMAVKVGTDMQQLPRVKTLLKVLTSAASARPGTDIPGVGIIDTRRPDWVNSPAGIATRQAALDMAAVILKEDSGAQATDQEWARKMAANGFSEWGDEKGFKIGVKRINKIMRDMYRVKRAKYPPEIVEEVERRFGEKFEIPEGAEGHEAPKGLPPGFRKVQ